MTDNAPQPYRVESAAADPASTPGDSTPAAEGVLLLEQVFGRGSLPQLRSAVAAQAAEAGLPQDRTDDAVLTLNELVSNVLRHGSGQARLQVHRQDHSLQFRVTDTDPPSADGQADAVASGTPPWPVEPGHGLWVVCRLADQTRFEIDQHGSTAIASFAVGPGTTAAQTTAGIPKMDKPS